MALLIADHKSVEGFFAEFDRLNDQYGEDTNTSAVGKHLCDAAIHTECDTLICVGADRTIVP